MPLRPPPRRFRAALILGACLTSLTCGAPSVAPRDIPPTGAAQPAPPDTSPPSAPVPRDTSAILAPAASTSPTTPAIPVPQDTSTIRLPSSPALPAEPAPADSTPLTWWCACHARAGTPPVPATACRRERDACERLAHKARHGGGPAIAPGSLTHRCRELRAAHPRDLLGGDPWQDGDRPGNLLSEAGCLLSGPPDVPPGPPSLLDDEQLGELQLGLPAARVFALLGPPTRRGAATLSKKTGLYLQPWHYPDHGLELRFEAGEKKGPYRLAAVRAVPPCTLRTARGVGLGDSLAAVERAYLAERAPHSDDRTFITGAPKRGILFTFAPETRTVVEIFLGTPSE